MQHEGDRVDEPVEHAGSEHDERSEDPGGRTTDDAHLAGTPVVVRRNAGLAAVIGAAASAIAIAYLWRAVDTGAALDWALCLVLALIAGFYLAALLDARTPLVVADDLGVRIRLGNQWRGLPWDAVAAAEVHPRRSLVHDGRLVFRPHSLGRALDGLDVRGRRHATLNQKLYGAALAVPLGLTTRTSSSAEVMAEELLGLSGGRVDVQVVVPQSHEAEARREAEPEPLTVPEREPARESALAEVIAAEAEPLGDSAVEDRPARRSLLGGIGTIVSRVAKANRHDVDAQPVDAADELDEADAAHDELVDAADADPERDLDDDRSALPGAATVAAFRTARPALRAQVTRDTPATTLGAAALHEEGAGRRHADLPEGRELRRPGSVDLVFEPVVASAVRPIARLGDPVDPLVIDGFVTEPAYDPVIGPELAAARTRLGLSVDELAERTRIRPHVIESIEVDDFSPCGGDFYARGHLRTLARVLGQDPAPLLEAFDNRYATAPINARRVFEAELATGMTGTMRSTMGGPNWGLLIGAVLSLVLVWGVVRLFASEPPELIQDPAPVLNGSAGVQGGLASAPQQDRTEPGGRPMPMMLVASQASTRVVVRDGDREIVFAGQLVVGERKSLKVEPPVHVQAANAGAVEVRVRGRDHGFIGELGETGRRTFHRPVR